MNGTSVSVTRDSRLRPPRSTAPSKTAVTAPTIPLGMSNELESPCAIELHWLMLPIPNDASTQNSAKAPANSGLCRPFFRLQHGSTAPAAVRSPLAVEACRACSPQSRHHADKGAHPQPEHRARTAERQRGCHARDIARADRCGKCGAHGRKRRNAAAFVRLAAPVKQENSVFRSQSAQYRT